MSCFQVYLFDKKKLLGRVLLDFLGSFSGRPNRYTGSKSSLDTALIYPYKIYIKMYLNYLLPTAIPFVKNGDTGTTCHYITYFTGYSHERLVLLNSKNILMLLFNITRDTNLTYILSSRKTLFSNDYKIGYGYKMCIWKI